MFGANSSTSLLAVVITVLAGAVYYFGYKLYQRSRGVDVDMVFKEIPPE